MGRWPRFILCLCLFFCFVSCAPTSKYVWDSSPKTAQASNEFFDAQLSAGCSPDRGCAGFVLVVKNKTDKNIEVNWNKSLYIANGQTSGGFMFGGVVYKDRNNPKAPDMIFASGNLIKSIWPNNLVSYSSGKYGGWRHDPMPPGENGIFLTTVLDGKEVTEKLTVTVTARQR